MNARELAARVAARSRFRLGRRGATRGRSRWAAMWCLCDSDLDDPRWSQDAGATTLSVSFMNMTWER